MANLVYGWVSFVNTQRRNSIRSQVEAWLAERPQYVPMAYPKPLDDFPSIPAGVNNGANVGGNPSFTVAVWCESQDDANTAIDTANTTFEAGGFVRESNFGSEYTAATP